MNKKKLALAEAHFMRLYPGGFDHPDMQAIGKKHKVERMTALAQEEFAKGKFRNPETVAEAMVKIVSRSSLVSVFEKPRFRDSVRIMSHSEKDLLTTGLEEFLHGKRQAGFELMTEALVPWKLAKWSLVTVIPNYFRPQDEVFVKPTTAKGVIEYFELEGLDYSPRPNWAFYKNFRAEIDKMKPLVDPALSPSNAAFLGFLMMSFMAAQARD